MWWFFSKMPFLISQLKTVKLTINRLTDCTLISQWLKTQLEWLQSSLTDLDFHSTGQTGSAPLSTSSGSSASQMSVMPHPPLRITLNCTILQITQGGFSSSLTVGNDLFHTCYPVLIQQISVIVTLPGIGPKCTVQNWHRIFDNNCLRLPCAILTDITELTRAACCTSLRRGRGTWPAARPPLGALLPPTAASTSCTPPWSGHACPRPASTVEIDWSVSSFVYIPF